MRTQIPYKFSLSYHKINYAMNFGTLYYCFSQDPPKFKFSSDVGPVALPRSGFTREAFLE